MKIAITADVHLTTREKNPERIHALQNILDQMVTLEMETLIIAGDCFDATSKDPGLLEVLIQNEKYAKISVFILPGNHDLVLSTGAFAQRNIKYITEPTLVDFSTDSHFLFLPYRSDSSIGEALAATSFDLKPDAWVLVAHGDYLSSSRIRNNSEGGLYMPLSSRDIQIYKPEQVFLGHIHAKLDIDRVHYPGSPCGLDPTETGIRSFIIYDSSTGSVERVAVESDVIFFQELLTILPVSDEGAYIVQLLADKIAAWRLDERQKQKARVRIALQGYSINRDHLSKVIVDTLNEKKLVLSEPPDLGKVKLSTDGTLAEIASEVQKRIIGKQLPTNPDEPTNDEYVLSALNQIYGG